MAKHVGIRTDRYKLIWFYENKGWELYDLLKDKNELHNVYNDPHYMQIQHELKEQLHQLEVKYKDTEMINKT